MEGGNMTRDQFLAEKVMGKTYFDGTYIYHECPNFALWPDKGRLIDFCMAQEWWDALRQYAVNRYYEAMDSGMYDDYVKYLLDNFADLVFEYKGGVVK